MLCDGKTCEHEEAEGACGSVLHCSCFMAVIALASLKYKFAFYIVNLNYLT